MKPIEAKIIILLDQINPLKRNVINVAVKLEKSYDYISKLLNMMVVKNYLIPHSSVGKKFYMVHHTGLVKEAKEVLSNE